MMDEREVGGEEVGEAPLHRPEDLLGELLLLGDDPAAGLLAELREELGVPGRRQHLLGTEPLGCGTFVSPPLRCSVAIPSASAPRKSSRRCPRPGIRLRGGIPWSS